jgi:translocation and assembly module TamA
MATTEARAGGSTASAVKGERGLRARLGRIGWLGLLAALVPTAALLAQDEAPATDGEAATETAPLPDALPYAATLEPVADENATAALTTASNLLKLQSSPPSGPVGLVRRALADRERLYGALGALSYYGGQVHITIDGVDMDDPGLVDRLTARQSKDPVKVSIKIDLGPSYKFDTVRLTDTKGSDQLPLVIDRAPLGLDPGKPALSATILSAEGAMVAQMNDQGYPLAKVPSRDAVVDHADQTMDLTEFLDPGPKAGFGPVTVEGEETVRESFIQSRVPFVTGQIYSPQQVQDLRKDLADLGVFSNVRVTTADQVDAQGNVPVTIAVQERPLRFVGFGAKYETNYGAGINAYWGHRNLWGGAEQLRIDGEVSGLGYNDATEPNFKFGVSLKVPGFFDRNTTLDSKAEAVREVLDAYTSTRGLVQSIATYKYSKEIDLLAGLSFETGHVENDEGEWDYTFVGIPLGAKIDTTNSLLDPTEGYRAQLSLTPYPTFLGSSVDMIVAKALGSAYVDLSGGDGDIVLAGQLGISSIAGPNIADVPPDKRLYAGGGGSVRGYKYQSIGPLNKEDNPIGGLSSIIASLELRYKITDTIGIVPFFDAGGVYEKSVPDFGSDIQYAAGLGARYYTGIGPIRADIAIPLNKRKSDDSFQLYISIGQAF